MRIVHVITRLIIGGAQENTLLSCEGQHDRGHDVTLVTGPPIGPEGSLLQRAQSYGYRVVVLDEMGRSILPIPIGSMFTVIMFGIFAYQSYQLLVQAQRDSRWLDDRWQNDDD